MSNESFIYPYLPSFPNPSSDYLGTKIRPEHNKTCLKQHNVKYTHGKTVNIDIVYELIKKNVVWLARH